MPFEWVERTASYCDKHRGMVAHDVAQNRLTEAIMALAYELINFGSVRRSGSPGWPVARV